MFGKAMWRVQPLQPFDRWGIIYRDYVLFTAAAVREGQGVTHMYNI